MRKVRLSLLLPGILPKGDDQEKMYKQVAVMAGGRISRRCCSVAMVDANRYGGKFCIRVINVISWKTCHNHQFLLSYSGQYVGLSKSEEIQSDSA